jgi:tetratricopeptide (TPR) repeat protein
LTGLFNNPRRHLRTLIKQARKEKDSAKRNKKYDEALEYGHGIEKKLEHDPDIAFIIGTIYYIKGDSEKTLEYMDKTLEIGIFDLDALAIKASVYLNLKNKDKVIECCNKIKELDPKNKSLLEIEDELKKI